MHGPQPLTVLDASDRNLLAMSLTSTGKGVAAGADHGLHCFDLARQQVMRALKM